MIKKKYALGNSEFILLKVSEYFNFFNFQYSSKYTQLTEVCILDFSYKQHKGTPMVLLRVKENNSENI